jgi:hypothetical protein
VIGSGRCVIRVMAMNFMRLPSRPRRARQPDGGALQLSARCGFS